MDDWEKFNETSLPGKEDCYSNLTTEDITNADYGKRFCKDFKMKNSGEYVSCHVQSDTLLLADIFEIFLCVVKYMNLIPLVFLLHQL